MTRKVEHILMVVADTVRWDYLGFNGGHVRTPNLDALARKSVVFQDHHAVSFPTVPARYDYLTGQPSYASVGWGPLPRDTYSVTPDLAAAGYTALGVVDTPFYRAHGYAYDRGFDYFYDMGRQPLGTPAYHLGERGYDPSKRRERPINGKLIPEPRLAEQDHAAPGTMAMAESCLEYLYERPFFALVDTWDPHEPWDAPGYYVRHYLPDFAGERVFPPYTDWRSAGLTERDLEVARANYSGKLEMVDRWTGHLLDKVDRLGIGDTTAILFVSDHGFFFGEHGYLGKMVKRAPAELAWQRSPLYSELTHVPLMIKLPGVVPRTVDQLTSALDLVPTLLELGGVERPVEMCGRSLLPVLLEEPSKEPRAIVTAMPLANPGDTADVVDSTTRNVLAWQPVTVTTSEWTFLYSVPGEPVELYSRTDRGQHENVAGDHSEVVQELTDWLLSEFERLRVDQHYLTPRRASAAVRT